MAMGICGIQSVKAYMLGKVNSGCYLALLDALQMEIFANAALGTR